MSVTPGLKGEASAAVSPANTARAMGSGTLEVFATPAMAALMEQAACTSLLPFLAPGQSSVGTGLTLSHLYATPVGLTVRAESEVTAVEGRTVTFRVAAYDDAGLIGQGTHQRAIVDEERFLSRAAQKKEGQ